MNCLIIEKASSIIITQKDGTKVDIKNPQKFVFELHQKPTSQVLKKNNNVMSLTKEQELRTLRCTNIPSDTKAVELTNIFLRYGKIQCAYIVPSEKKFTTGIVVFEDERNLRDALELDGCVFGGRRMFIERCRPRVDQQHNIRVNISQKKQVSGSTIYKHEWSRAIRCKNVASKVSNGDILSLFGEFGPIEKIWFHPNNEGVVVIVYKNKKDTFAPVENCNGRELDGKVIQVEKCVDPVTKPRKPSRLDRSLSPKRKTEKKVVDKELRSKLDEELESLMSSNENSL